MGFWSGTGCGREPPLIAGGLGTCCGAVAICLLVVGNHVKDANDKHADYDYKLATCSVMSTTLSSYLDKQQAGKSRTVYTCSLIVTTSLTGDRNFTLAGTANKDGCIQFGSQCDYSVPRNCRGDCWVVYDGDNIVDLSIMSKAATEALRTGINIAFVVIAVILFVCCCLTCCGAIVSGTLQILEERDGGDGGAAPSEG